MRPNPVSLAGFIGVYVLFDQIVTSSTKLPYVVADSIAATKMSQSAASANPQIALLAGCGVVLPMTPNHETPRNFPPPGRKGATRPQKL